MSKGTVLVTGAAGYIGSHAVLALLEAGWEVVAVDDLSSGARWLVPETVEFIHQDVAERRRMVQVLGDYRCRAVLHFAGSIVVSESVADPLKYYRNNVGGSLALIEACAAADVTRFIFSSSAAVYGEPLRVPVDEDAPTNPINPYGATKLIAEWMLRDAAALGLRHMALRYFNVAGADPSGRSGQLSLEATHLIKIACEAAANKRPGVTVFGTDYETPDGTCIRDYIHVSDLATAHVAALDHLMAGGPSLTLNCGYGHGASVRQVLAAVERAAGVPLEVGEGPRRPGDPARLVADSGRMRRLLAWTPEHDDLDAIVASALAWERNTKDR